MKQRTGLILLLAVILGIAGTVPGYAQKAGKRMFGVAFYNLENLFDTINNNGNYDLEFSPEGKNNWDGTKYWHKINNMAYAISRFKTKTTPMGPALIGVSEIENRTVLEDLVKADALKDLNLQIVHHDSPDLRGVDVGLLYNPRFFQLINVTNHPLTTVNFKTRDQMCVVGLLGGKRVGVIVNHWPSRRGGEKSVASRVAAANLTRHIADSLLAIDPTMGIIIMGDLNDDPSDKSCAITLGAVKKADMCKPGGLYNPFWRMLEKGIGSYIYRGGWDLFDQIIVNYNLVSGDAGLKFYDAKVLNFEFLKQPDGQYKGYPWRTFASGAWSGGYSDHFPTEIFLIQEIEEKR